MAKANLWADCEHADQQQHIQNLKQSRFFVRLQQCDSQADVTDLISTVKKVWQQVAEVTKNVSVDFRDYTLHDMKHLGNVLWLMEQLVPPALWKK